MNDKDESVRLAVLSSLEELYSAPANHAPMETFTQRFLDRMLQLFRDADDEARAALFVKGMH